MITHTKTRYTVVIPEVNVTKLKNLRHWFLDHLINQLIKCDEGIDLSEFDPAKVEDFIGEFELYQTNNDKSCISYINKRIEDWEYWKQVYPSGSIPYYQLGALSNHLGTMLRNGKSEFIRPTIEMLELLNSHSI